MVCTDMYLEIGRNSLSSRTTTYSSNVRSGHSSPKASNERTARQLLQIRYMHPSSSTYSTELTQCCSPTTRSSRSQKTNFKTLERDIRNSSSSILTYVDISGTRC